MNRFADRTEAGRRLAQALADYAGLQGRSKPLVLALPRGGVPVGAVVADALGASLDVFIVRKLGVPGHEELAMGAIASGGLRVLNAPVIDTLGITDDALETAVLREQRELARREALYRAARPALEVGGRTVVLVDDGLATGATMLAAVRALRRAEPAKIVVAVPVAPFDTCALLRAEADDVVCLAMPEPFWGVGRWYDDFTQTGDAEVAQLLAPRAERPDPPAVRAE